MKGRLEHAAAVVLRAAIVVAVIPASDVAFASPAQSETSSAERQYASATGLLNRGLNDMAVSEYRAFLKEHPNHEKAALARYGLGVALFRLQKFEEAERELAAMGDAKGFEFAAETLLIRGQCLVQAEKFVEAAKPLQRLIEQHSNHAKAADAAALLMEAQFRSGDFKATRTVCRTIESNWPQHPSRERCMYFDGLAALSLEDFSAAAQAFENLHKQFPKSEFRAQTDLLLATCWHRAGDHERALKQYDAIIKQSKNEDAIADALYARGAILQQKNPEEAVKSFDRLVQQYPKHRMIETAGFARAMCLHRLNRTDEALAALQPFAKGKQTKESHRRALLALGDISFVQEKWDAAITYLTDYLSFGVTQPSADDAALKIGLAQARANRLEDAAKTFARVLKDFPESPHRVQATFELGQIELAQKKLDAAIEKFEQVLQSAGDSRFAPFARNHLAAIAMQKQQYDRAASLYEQVLNDPAAKELAPEALFQRAQALMAANKRALAAEAFADFATRHPKHERAGLALAQRGLALARLGQHEEALRLIAGVEKTHAAALDATTLASLRYEKAWCQRELKRDADAAKSYRELLAAHADHPLAMNAALELAEIEMNAKRFSEAETLLVSLREKLKSNASAPADLKEQSHYRLAVCKYETGEFKNAATLFDLFIKDYVNSPMQSAALSLCGESHYKAGNFAAAAEAFNNFAEKAPNDPANAAALLRIGECAASLQNWPQSEKAFAAFLKKHANHELWFQAQFGMAWAMENQSQHEKAIAAYKPVVDRHSGPTAARAQFQIGECLYAQKKHEEAVRELLKVDILYAYPEWSAAALYEAGRCFEELGKPAEARTQFEQVQQKHPQSRWAELASQRLTAIASANGNNNNNAQ